MKMEPLELGARCRIECLVERGFRRTKKLNGRGFPDNTFCHKNGNRIYIVHEIDEFKKW